MLLRALGTLFAVGLVLGCAGGGGDSAPDAGDDSDPRDYTRMDTAYVAFVHAGSFTAADGQLLTVDVGYSWVFVDGSGSVCDFHAPATVNWASNCVDCDWSFAINAVPEEPTGPGCAQLAGADGGAAAVWPYYTTGFGWSDRYTWYWSGFAFTYYDVVWEYFWNSQAGTGAWYTVAWNWDYIGVHEVDGDGNGATFHDDVGRGWELYYGDYYGY